MALDSLIHAESAQEPTSTNRNAVLVDDGAMPSMSTAILTVKQILVDDGALPSMTTAAPTANRSLVDDGAMPSTSTPSPAVDSDSLTLVSEATSANSVERSGREVDESFMAAFPLSARTVPALARGEMSTAHSDKHGTSLLPHGANEAILKN